MYVQVIYHKLDVVLKIDEDEDDEILYILAFLAIPGSRVLLVM